MRAWMWCVVGLALAGCGGAMSDHPLSDASDSVLDEGLIGVWEGVAKGKENGDRPRLYVGKLEGSERVLEVVLLELDHEDHINVMRFRAFATRLGTISCVSLTDEEGKAYLLLRYEFDDAGRLFLRVLDEQKVVDAIRAKQIAGRVKENPGYGKSPFEFRRYEDVRITAPTKALRAWLEKAPATWEKLGEDQEPFRKLIFKMEAKGK